MKKNLMTLIACAGMISAFTGCKSTSRDHGAYLPENVTVNDLENRTALVLMNERVQKSVTCPGIQETRLPDGRLQVVAHLRNREDRSIQVQADCVFKDAQGFDIDSAPFTNVFLDENAQQDVQFVSMSDKAQRYTIRIREAH